MQSADQVTQHRSDELFNREKPGQSGTSFKQITSTVADKLHDAAETLDQKARQSDQESKLSQFGLRAADWMKRSADYVDDLEPRQIRLDLENQVRRHPGRSLLLAGAVGLLVGGLLRRR